MIALHRLAREPEPFLLNPDLVQTVEARPDTIVALTTGERIPVVERPAEVRRAILDWRSRILSDALRAANVDESVVPIGRR